MSNRDKTAPQRPAISRVPAVVRFVNQSFRPFRALSGGFGKQVAEAAVGFSGIGLIERWLWVNHGVMWSLVVGLGALAALFLFEGTRRERAARAVRVSWASVPPEMVTLAQRGRAWKLSVEVTNRGADATFHAFGDDFNGLVPPPKQPDFPWEGETVSTQLIRRDVRKFINLGYIGHSQEHFAVSLPETIYSGPNQQSIGPGMQVVESKFEITVVVNHEATGERRKCRVVVRLHPSSTDAPERLPPPTVDVKELH